MAPADVLTELERVAIAYVHSSDAVGRHFSICTLCRLENQAVECAEGLALVRARALIYNALVRAAFGPHT